ncbi:hypothetical protein DQ04_04101080 [Trypanosoma grayi]|uniref:hypothetical protein n=1 Tax=Trypanosoma grayi TaxID=71804 RepID=UPI0004F44B3F|nr:hypothetical protein DQ04_04101080 [Trypanosoma grayi]KEG10165.1 hypothetical protein DQ04_04101080 [Trypanosoma grayi]
MEECRYANAVSASWRYDSSLSIAMRFMYRCRKSLSVGSSPKRECERDFADGVPAVAAAAAGSARSRSLSSS